jgi:hypothetical protein
MSAVGFGKSPKALGFLETLAKRGSGSFIQITSEQQAETMLIDNMMQHSIKN